MRVPAEHRPVRDGLGRRSSLHLRSPDRSAGRAAAIRARLLCRSTRRAGQIRERQGRTSKAVRRCPGRVAGDCVALEGPSAAHRANPRWAGLNSRWAGSHVWQLGLVAERDDVLGNRSLSPYMKWLLMFSENRLASVDFPTASAVSRTSMGEAPQQTPM